jgi:hypothetical protein
MALRRCIQGRCNGEQVQDLWHNGAPGNVTGEYAEDIFLTEVLRVISNHPIEESAPLYLNYNMHIPHLPEQITDEYAARYVGNAGAFCFVEVCTVSATVAARIS